MNQEEMTGLQESSFSFWKNVILVIAFFVLTPVAIATSIFSLFSLRDASKVTSEIVKESSEPLVLSHQVTSGAQVFASLPSSIPSISGSVGVEDARPEIVRKYLEDYNSPLEPYAEAIVAAADKYSLDYRLLTAIAQQESNLCKVIPPGSHNCWGWGIHSQGTLYFDSYEEAIFTVSEGLKENYLDKGYSTPEEIMAKYTPLSNGSWAWGVEKFMSELE